MNMIVAPEKLAPAGGAEPGERRRFPFEILRLPKIPRSIAVCVVLPTLLAAAYFGLIASDQYVAEAHFAVRGNEPAAPDLLGTLTGVSGGGSAADAYAVRDYILSREGFEAVAGRIDVRSLFARPEADWPARLDPDAPIEDIVRYWNRRVGLAYEPTTGISTLTVTAFTPDDAVALAEALLAEGERLVNRMSERARGDALAFADAQVKHAEQRLVAIRARITEFRDQSQLLDPARMAEGKLGIVAELETELARAQAELGTLQAFMQSTAAPIVTIENRIVALKAQIGAEQRKLASRQSGDDTPFSAVMADYQRLLGEQEFAERAYVSALTSLEVARTEALRQHRYLVSFVSPRLPERPMFPRRALSTLVVLLVASIVWGVGALTVAAIKDHTGRV
jgi:capsular polysaccharide transport system permease protein